MTGYVPTYRVILNDLRKSIASGQLKPGDKLPTLSELADKYDCALGTARRALEILLETGEIIGKQGKGTYVAEKKL
ncbi:GntR family transcriptional regulator [Micromonospora globbae]|uniref:GntR family transcriptional regulator n=1 Tax=Micromonospora globbae TaxID=1894969 RepID=A0A420ECB3_9ACTN|nr:GntR family transcriptional regulator [Micromonospora globbae]RKF18327.1 GntR family transcriptional regulator [Micromonospora globbae]